MSDEEKREKRRAAARECMRRKRAREREEKRKREQEGDEREEGPPPKRVSRKAAETARLRVREYLETLEVPAPSSSPRPPSPSLLELAKEAFCRQAAKLQEDTSQPATAPLSQPTNSPADKPTGQPTAQPTGKSIKQPTNQPTYKPTSQPAAQPTNRLTDPSADQLTGPPIGQSTGQPTDQRLGQPASPIASQLTNGQPAILTVRWELFPIPIGLGRRWATPATPLGPARPLALTWPQAADLREVERRLLRRRRLAYYLAPGRSQARGGDL